ncbi:hypothetical protein MAR_018256 [Mya arenaria]|uniref:Uncharacterized protein n=1 Tax=Mya arenaria TaxID=6604 RepID=A0ABY7EE78_MYAAR|nr:hypothetical protein MAR_018256 [Mya arenaria]
MCKKLLLSTKRIMTEDGTQGGFLRNVGPISCPQLTKIDLHQELIQKLTVQRSAVGRDMHKHRN